MSSISKFQVLDRRFKPLRCPRCRSREVLLVTKGRIRKRRTYEVRCESCGAAYDCVGDDRGRVYSVVSDLDLDLDAVSELAPRFHCPNCGSGDLALLRYGAPPETFFMECEDCEWRSRARQLRYLNRE